MTEPNSDIPLPQAATRPTEQTVRTLRSEDLLQGEREVRIVHGSETYRLLQTRNGKLILQK